MGLPEMVKRIQEEANLESERYMTEAKEKIARMQETSRLELKAIFDELKTRHEKDKKALWNMLVSEGRRRSRNAILSAKEELIWETMSALRERLKGLDGKELSTRLHPLIDTASRSLGSDMMVYPVRERDARSLPKSLRMGSIIEGASELPGVLDRFKGRDLLGGFIAVSTDGSKVMDMSFKGLLDKNEDALREVISRTLFE